MAGGSGTWEDADVQMLRPNGKVRVIKARYVAEALTHGWKRSVLQEMKDAPKLGQLDVEKVAPWAPLIGTVAGAPFGLAVPGAMAGAALRQDLTGSSNAMSGGLLGNIIPGAEVPGSIPNRIADIIEQGALGSAKVAGAVGKPLFYAGKKLGGFAMSLAPEAAQVAANNGITATTLGWNKLMNLIGNEGAKVAASLHDTPINTTFQPTRELVADITAPLVTKYSYQAIPGEAARAVISAEGTVRMTKGIGDLGVIDKLNRDFLRKGPMDFFKLFKLKQAEAELARKTWALGAKGQRVTDAELEWHRAIADWADETLKRSLPPAQKAVYEAYNATEHGLLSLKEALGAIVNPSKGQTAGAKLLRQTQGYSVGATVIPTTQRILGGAALGGAAAGGGWHQRTGMGLTGATIGLAAGNPAIGSSIAAMLENPQTAMLLARLLQMGGVAATGPKTPQGGPPVAP
jgi:hypothetical protein